MVFFRSKGFCSKKREGLGRRGTALVEFAFAGTIFFMLFFATLYFGLWGLLSTILEGTTRDVGRACVAALGTGSSVATQCVSSDGVRTMISERLPNLFDRSELKVSSYQFDNIAAARNHVPTQALAQDPDAETFDTDSKFVIIYEILYNSSRHEITIPFIGSLSPIRAYTMVFREPA